MFAVIDYETTGLVNEKSTDFMRQPGIVQLGLVVLNDQFQETDTLNTFVNPEIASAAWSQGAIDTHHITYDMVQGAPTYFALHQDFASRVAGSKYWVGYRSRFDRDVLWYQLLRYGLERNFPWPPQEIDVMRLATEHFNAKGKRGAAFLTLSSAYEAAFGKPFEGAHDALSDVRATAALLKEFGQDIF